MDLERRSSSTVLLGLSTQCQRPPWREMKTLVRNDQLCVSRFCDPSEHAISNFVEFVCTIKWNKWCYRDAMEVVFRLWQA